MQLCAVYTAGVAPVWAFPTLSVFGFSPGVQQANPFNISRDKSVIISVQTGVIVAALMLCFAIELLLEEVWNDDIDY